MTREGTTENTYFLEVTPNGSNWINEPKYSFSYNDIRNRLTSINLETGEHKIIKIATNGALVTDVGPGKKCFTGCDGSGSFIDIFDNGEGLLMKDQHGNILSVGEREFFPQALFNNREDYPQTPPNLKARPVLFQLMNPPPRSSNNLSTNGRPPVLSPRLEETLRRLREKFMATPNRRDGSNRNHRYENY